jgi:phospholipid/cholesterol/gamma-HCH transport system substrate-binding protein
MKVLDKRTAGDLTKLLIFIVVTTLATSVLVVTIGNISFSPKTEYKAEFVDATGVVKGDDVRIAGVKVGTVKDIQIVDRTRAMVTFSVQDDTALSRATHANIRYRNLVGQRYISLTQEIGDSGTLPEGATIPVSQTSPALDLTVLFNGFKPLFQALSPSDINQLSYEIIQVFQGEGGTVESLLSHVASLSSSLADKDQVIGSVIDNLTKVLGTVAARDQQLNDLIISLQQFVSGLAADKDAIFNSLQTIDTLAGTTAGLLDQARPPLAADIQQLQVLAGNVAAGGDQLEQFLQLAPTKLDLITRTAINGSWFNFFMCSSSGYVVLPATGVDGLPTGITAPAGSGLATGERGCQ